MDRLNQSPLSKILAALWLAAASALLLTLVSQWRGFDSIETDLLKLLPRDSKPQYVQNANEVFLREVSQRIVFMLAGSSLEESLQIAEKYSQDLEGSGFFHNLDVKQAENIQNNFRDLYFPFKENIYLKKLFPENREGQFVNILKDRVARILAMPITPDLGFFIKNDPFFLFLDFLSGLPQLPGKLQFHNGFLIAEYQDKSFAFIRASLKKSVFNNSFQKDVSSFLHQLDQEYKKEYAAIKILQGGALKFAEVGSAKAEKDIVLISWGSTISTIVILLLVFRSLMPLFISIATVTLSIFISTAVALIFFPKIHLVTLGFGASLIGVCADYSFHFFCHRLGKQPLGAKEIISRIGSAISLGVATGILGYVGLFLLPFPGLTQMALFAIVGMLSSWLSVMLWYPFLPDSWLSKGVYFKDLDGYFLKFPQDLFQKFKEQMQLLIKFRLHYFLIILALWGLFELEAEDDVRSLQSNTTEMLQEEKEIRELNGNIDQSRYFLLADKEVEDLLEKEMKLTERLDQIKQDKTLGSYQAISKFLPSLQSQKEKHNYFRTNLLKYKNEIIKEFSELGFSEESLQKYILGLETEGFQGLSPEIVLNNPIITPLKFLWLGKQGGKWVSMVLLQDVKYPEVLRNFQSQDNDIYFIDLVNDSSFVLKTYRIYAAIFILIFYIAVYITLIIRYGFKFGSLAILPGMLALMVNLSLHGLFGLDINLFSILANAIVLGLAVDYSIFLLEDDSDRAQTMLAILLSAVSTIASFGLLAISSTPLLSAFGISMFIGIVLSLLFCPIASRSLGKG